MHCLPIDDMDTDQVINRSRCLEDMYREASRAASVALERDRWAEIARICNKNY